MSITGKSGVKEEGQFFSAVCSVQRSKKTRSEQMNTSFSKCSHSCQLQQATVVKPLAEMSTVSSSAALCKHPLFSSLVFSDVQLDPTSYTSNDNCANHESLSRFTFKGAAVETWQHNNGASL